MTEIHHTHVYVHVYVLVYVAMCFCCYACMAPTDLGSKSYDANVLGAGTNMFTFLRIRIDVDSQAHHQNHASFFCVLQTIWRTQH